MTNYFELTYNTMVCKDTWDKFGFFDDSEYKLPGCVKMNSFDWTRVYYQNVVNQVFTPEGIDGSPVASTKETTPSDSADFSVATPERPVETRQQKRSRRSLNGSTNRAKTKKNL